MHLYTLKIILNPCNAKEWLLLYTIIHVDGLSWPECIIYINNIKIWIYAKALAVVIDLTNLYIQIFIFYLYIH